MRGLQTFVFELFKGPDRQGEILSAPRTSEKLVVVDDRREIPEKPTV